MRFFDMIEIAHFLIAIKNTYVEYLYIITFVTDKRKVHVSPNIIKYSLFWRVL